MFHIQHSCPKILTPVHNHYSELGEAIQNLFQIDTEMAFLFWKGHYIPMSYKYDISVCIDDIISCLEKIINANETKIFLTFGSDTFNAYWKIDCNNDELHISAQWDHLRGQEKFIDRNIIIKISANNFISEWRGILQTIDKTLILNNILLSDEQNLLDRMRKIIANTNALGQLYQ